VPDAESPALDLGRIPHAGVVNADGTLLEPPDLWKRDPRPRVARPLLPGRADNLT